jgi:hypothetical protein
MKVNPSDFFKYIGFLVYIENEKYIPNGEYIIFSRNEYGIELFSKKDNTFYLLEEWDEETYFEIKKNKTIIDDLLEALIISLINLLEEPYLHKDLLLYKKQQLKELTEIKEILNEKN